MDNRLILILINLFPCISFGGYRSPEFDVQEIIIIDNSVSSSMQPLAGTDDLERTLPLIETVGNPKANRQVGIFYFLWQGDGTAENYWDLSKIMVNHPEVLEDYDDPYWGKPVYYHGELVGMYFWGKPIYGYYRGDDYRVHLQSLQLLTDVGVDFLVIDVSNSQIYSIQSEALMKAMDAIRAQGKNPPKIDPKSLTTEEQQYIEGVKACVWTEYISTLCKLEYMLLPHMPALAEVGWSSLENKNYQNFSEVRILLHLAKLDAWGCKFRVPTAFRSVDTTLIGDKFTFDLKPIVVGRKIYFTIDGTVPRITDFEYTAPLNFFVSVSQKRELQTIVVIPSGYHSIATKTIMYNRESIPPTEYLPGDSGLKHKLMKGRFASVNNIELVQVADTEIAQMLNPNQFKGKFPAYGAIYEGYINIKVDGNYKFILSSTDGAQLFIDNDLVGDNDAPMTYPRDGAFPLLKGYHKIKIKYYCSGRGSAIWLFKIGPDGIRKDLAGKDMILW